MREMQPIDVEQTKILIRAWRNSADALERDAFRKFPFSYKRSWRMGQACALRSAADQLSEAADPYFWYNYMRVFIDAKR